MDNRFHPFSLEHGLTVAIGFAILAIVLLLAKRGGNVGRYATLSLAWINFAAYPITLISWIAQGKALGPEEWLPFHLCDVASITAGIALLTKHPLASTMTYFWGLAGTMQGLLTPAIEVGFPGPACLTFFLQHFAIVAAALHLPIVQGWSPRRPLWRAVAEIVVWSFAYLLFALAANALTGADFGYASHPPENPSLLDHLGPWPWYLFSMMGVAVFLYSLLCLPFLERKPTP